MSRKFTLVQDYYEEGSNLYKNKTITIKKGVTVLVGCNGIGKTTLLHQIRDSLKKKDIPCITFDNLHDGGSNSVSEAIFYGDISFGAIALSSSEGENIVMNIGKLGSKLKYFVKVGKEKKNYLVEAFTNLVTNEDEKEVKEIPKERWILLDAVDSGLSVDNIVDIKEQLFKTILEYNYGNKIYIVISANEYEMARDEECLDVYNGKYVKFEDYEEYRNMILKSKEWKYKRDEVSTNADDKK